MPKSIAKLVLQQSKAVCHPSGSRYNTDFSFNSGFCGLDQCCGKTGGETNIRHCRKNPLTFKKEIFKLTKFVQPLPK